MVLFIILFCRSPESAHVHDAENIGKNLFIFTGGSCIYSLLVLFRLMRNVRKAFEINGK